ncbi:MAG: GntR family transcriptional regulator [Bifidobacteriaceae bacterium]|nr:GntR family transcriptional regulator [Bifidobacteriaceae bacterium]
MSPNARAARYASASSADDAAQSTPPLERRAMRDDVRDAILAMLMDGRLEPGAAVGIDRTASLLGVSPTPVREALAELEATGLVERSAHRGYQAAPPVSAAQAREMADVRLLVEPAAAAGATRRAGAGFLGDLAAAHRAHTDAAHLAADWDGSRTDDHGLPIWMVPYFHADWSFHLTIADHCGNRYLQRLIASLGAPQQRMRQSAGGGRPDWREAVAEHSQVLRAVESGDPDRAAEAMRAHLEALRDRSIADA